MVPARADEERKAAVVGARVRMWDVRVWPPPGPEQGARKGRGGAPEGALSVLHESFLCSFSQQLWRQKLWKVGPLCRLGLDPSGKGRSSKNWGRVHKDFSLLKKI